MKLGEISITMSAYRISFIFKIIQINQYTLTDLKDKILTFEGEVLNFNKFKEIIRFNTWRKLKELFSSND